MILPTRDSVFWTISIIGGAAAALVLHFKEFPWIPLSVQHGIELVAFLWTVGSAKLSWSPLPVNANVALDAKVDGAPGTKAVVPKE